MESQSITGTVEANDGNTATVHFSDGAVKLFFRGYESKQEFCDLFLVGSSRESTRLEVDLNDREGLFNGIKGVFPNSELKYSVALITGAEDRGLVGVGVTIGNSDVTVFCAPACESPDGSDGRYFALGRGEQWEWLEVSPENFEYVCGEIEKAAAWAGRGVHKKIEVL